LRIGLVGAPRADKLVDEFLEGVRRSRRTDLKVVCWSLDADDRVPVDPRIAIAEPYAMVDEATYALRLSACDAIALPFRPDGDMLGTGTVFDAIGVGLVSLTSDWDFLTEMLGDGGIVVGHRADDIAAALDSLDDERIAAARAATLDRREHVLWSDIGARTIEVFEDAIRSTRPA
jgi:glycosyltransferase involved in cell wall biosynthesis